ncbi:MAG: hypothetical protein ACK4FR_09380 [Tabrizicola sp.]
MSGGIIPEYLLINTGDAAEALLLVRRLGPVRDLTRTRTGQPNRDRPEKRLQ